MERLSYSKIDTFKKCPLQFAHIYVFKDVATKDSEALRYGEFLHSILEDLGQLVKNNGNIIPDNISSVATESWKKHGSAQRIPGSLMQESRGILSSYGKILRGDHGYSIIGNEHKFDMVVGGFKITGKIDQILEKNGGLLIRDFKTNKNMKYLLDDLLQLKIYVLATAKELNISPDKIMASFMFLRFDCDERPKRFSADDIIETEIYLEAVGHQIGDAMASGKYKAIMGPLCPYCAAIDKCPAAQSTSWIMRRFTQLKAEGKL